MQQSTIETFLHLLNRDGYVLDFSDEKFNSFTYRCVGIRIKKNITNQKENH